MHALVTGVAGFIGSNLARTLLARGDTVTGADCFTPYYDEAQKRHNLGPLLDAEGFDFRDGNLLDADLSALLDGVDVVYHQAGQPGVRLSWSAGFDRYDDLNVRLTQRLLEAAVTRPPRRFVFASSSSVYGNAASYPTYESTLPRPHSPYGVTKLAAEHLCGLYAEVHGVPTVSLRYFTVYGPGQRPDMFMHRLIDAALREQAVPLYGDGSQVREFTFVDDVVAANLAAAEADVEPGLVVNVAGGSSVTVMEVIERVQSLMGRPVALDRLPPASGDVGRTSGDIELAHSLLGWEPRVDLDEGLRQQVAWHRALLGSA